MKCSFAAYIRLLFGCSMAMSAVVLTGIISMAQHSIGIGADTPNPKAILHLVPFPVSR